MSKKDPLPRNERRGRGHPGDDFELEGAGLDDEGRPSEDLAGEEMGDEPTADDPEPSEHTSIDRGLLDRLRESEPEETPPDAPKGPDVHTSSTGPFALSNDPNLVGGASTTIDTVQSMLDLPSTSGAGAGAGAGAGPGPKRTGTLILDQSPFKAPPEGTSGLSNLGPAFPESGDEPKPSEVPTTAKPSSPIKYAEGGPEIPTKERRAAGGSSPGAEADAWDGFEDAGDSWSKSDSASASGESRLDLKPKKGIAKVDTNVYKRGAKNKGEEGARLVSVDGDKGLELAVDGDDMTVGRENDNHIVVKDPSVSRKHARIVRAGPVYELIDLQSGNGTFVNGKRVADRVNLNSGDEVRFGNATFRFLELGDVFKPVDASGAPVLPGARGSVWSRLRDNPRVRVFAVSAVLVLVTLGVAFTLFSKRRRADPFRQAQVFNAYLRGVEQFKQRRWSSAESNLAAALKLQPDHERSRKYLDAIVVEKRAEQALKEARAAHAAGDLARAYLAALGTEDSVHFASDGDNLLRNIESAADKRIESAREALAQGNREEAARLLDGLEFFEVYRAGLGDLRAQAGLTSKKGEPPRQENKGPDRDRKPDEPKAPEREIKVNAVGPFADVINLFAEGKVQEARKKIGRSNDREAKILEAKIQKFADVYDSALREHQGKRYNAAIKMFTDALAYEEKITGGRSKLAYDVRDKLADVYYLRGITEFSQQQYAEAYRDFKTALQTSPNHAQSSRMMGQLETRAGEVYRQAYAMAEQSPDKAKDLYRTVLKMVPPTHEVYRKAKERLDALK